MGLPRTKRPDEGDHRAGEQALAQPAAEGFRLGKTPE
jgi:hypothetical protein